MLPLRLHRLFIVVLCAAAFLAGCTVPTPDCLLNRQPTADAGSDQNVDAGQRVCLNGLASTDPDDDPLTYIWQQRSGPSASLDDPNNAEACFVPVRAGIHEFTLSVTDGCGGADTSVVRVFVGDVPFETCPRADAGVDQTVNEGGAVTLRGCNSADPAGGPLDYEWFQVSGAQVSINGLFVCEPAFAAPQVTGADIELEFELTVCNEQSCCDTDAVVITVRDRDPDDRCKDVECPDDGLFCNGVESCDDGVCVSGGDPCSPDGTCDEANDACDYGTVERTYTTDADFDKGQLAGVEHETVHDQLQLTQEPWTFPFIWIPNQNGTISKLDTETGRELGRYYAGPPGVNTQPSRTTVDQYGNCWVGNRHAGSVIKVGLLENDQCIDRNGNGIIDTSRDLNDDGDITGGTGGVEVVGQVFFLEEFDTSSNWRFRDHISIDFTGPPTAVPVITPTAESSATWDAGTESGGFTSDSADPLGPFSDQSVHYRGHQEGGSSERLGDAWLVYRFRVDFGEPVRINSITVSGAAFNPGDSLIRLLDDQHNVLAEELTSGGNTHQTFLLNFNTGDELLPWSEDECVLHEVIVIPGKEGTFAPGEYTGGYEDDYGYPGPRSIAVDAENNVWVGTHDTQTFYYLDGSTGEILQVIDVSPWDHCAYGAVIDTHGIVWSASHCEPWTNVLRLDPSTDPPAITNVDMGHFAYGLGLDHLGHLFATGWEASLLSRVDIASMQKEWTQSKPGLYQGRGVVCTSDNDVWAVSSAYNQVVRYDNDGNYKATIPVGATPTGVAVDAAGKVWACGFDETIHRIDPATNTVDLTKTVVGSGGHYTYSDMTGLVSRNITTKLGTWTAVFDSGQADTPWKMISWNANQPEGTVIAVRVRSSDNVTAWSGWEISDNESLLGGTPHGQYLQIEVTLQITSGDSSPILYDLTVESNAVD